MRFRRSPFGEGLWAASEQDVEVLGLTATKK